MTTLTHHFRALLLTLAIVSYQFNDASAFSPSSLHPTACLRSSSSPSSARSKSSLIPSSSSRKLWPLFSSEDGSINTPPSPLYDEKQLSAQQALGEKLIMQAALQSGATEPMINIEWKVNDRIVVTVDVSQDENYEEAVNDVWMDDDEGVIFDDEGIELMEDFDDANEEEEFDAEALGLEPIDESSDDNDDGDNDDGNILSLIARTINEVLSQDGEDSKAFQIAKLHQIEVTTPVFDGVLRGKLMFDSYTGFDVLVEHWEVPKKKKNKKIKSKAQKTVVDSEEVVAEVKEVVEEEQKKITITEGKLVGRDDEKEVTMINVKGRVMKIKNDLIESVTLPKAKKEKGAK